MKTPTLLVLFYLLINCTVTSQELLDIYLDNLKETLHSEAEENDVNELLILYDDEAVYEHPGIGMKIESKESIKMGMLSFLESYGGSSDDVEINKLQVILNNNVAVVKFEIRFLLKSGKKVERTQLQVIEISDGKISRILDYW
ncbi:MAG: nuclear transport factor 2 family protein [Cyclobacteriaceae bacterium]